MWSNGYNRAWGCRCCSDDGPHSGYHQAWDIWGVPALPPPAPSPLPSPPSPSPPSPSPWGIPALQPISGCTARTALNYRPFAVTDDGSCVQGGCMDSRFDAFEPVATFDDGSCPPVLPGCMQSDASNYRALATVEHEPSSCLYQGWLG